MPRSQLHLSCFPFLILWHVIFKMTNGGALSLSPKQTCLNKNHDHNYARGSSPIIFSSFDLAIGDLDHNTTRYTFPVPFHLLSPIHRKGRMNARWDEDRHTTILSSPSEWLMPSSSIDHGNHCQHMGRRKRNHKFIPRSSSVNTLSLILGGEGMVAPVKKIDWLHLDIVFINGGALQARSSILKPGQHLLMKFTIKQVSLADIVFQEAQKGLAAWNCMWTSL